MTTASSLRMFSGLRTEDLGSPSTRPSGILTGGLQHSTETESCKLAFVGLMKERLLSQVLCEASK